MRPCPLCPFHVIVLSKSVALRFLLRAHRRQARALVFSGAPDVPQMYNSVMNAIFSAQKIGVLVDCAVLGEPSTFLQQAAYLTGEFSPGASYCVAAQGVLRVMKRNVRYPVLWNCCSPDSGTVSGWVLLLLVSPRLTRHRDHYSSGSFERSALGMSVVRCLA